MSARADSCHLEVRAKRVAQAVQRRLPHSRPLADQFELVEQMRETIAVSVGKDPHTASLLVLNPLLQRHLLSILS